MTQLEKALIGAGFAANEKEAGEVIREARTAFDKHAAKHPGQHDVADRHDFFEARWGFDPEAHKKEALP